MTGSDEQIGALLAQGRSAIAARRFDRAEVAFAQAVALAPDQADGYLGLSHALLVLGRHAEAKTATMRLAAMSRLSPAQAFELARRLRHFNEYERLIALLRDQSLLSAMSPQQLAEAAVLLSDIGEHALALTLVERGLRLAPGHAASLYFKGNLLFFLGDRNGAEIHYEAALRADPAMAQAFWMMAALHTQRHASNHVGRLRDALRRCPPGSMGETYLNFALHKELHDLGEHAEAWQALEQACGSARRRIDYRLSDSLALLDGIERRCSPAYLAEPMPITEGGPRPIFIVGMHRSGTTLLEQMLVRHSQVRSVGESYLFPEQLRGVTNTAARDALSLDMLARLDSDALRRAGADYLHAAAWAVQGRDVLVEKLPANALNVGFIRKALPQARIVWMARDPMDTCFSNLRVLYSGVAGYSYTQHEMAGYFVAHQRLMQHWERSLPDALLRVDYAALVAQPEATLRQVAAFCGLPYQPQMLDLERAHGAVATASVGLMQGGLRADRARVWAPYAAQLQPLRSALGLA
ncbi:MULTISPECIES: sulfotransferase [Xanthomonas]|uniref:tetratricopeptide repeat-containing sulfotransferase family protein n=1 Tax=Xanthomonas TaxID=338 RepID=UPI0003A4B985|nr:MULTISPECIES: sulfotransferase [Xanthomonas]MCW0403830.1 hypothetical protein [Xanthomonas sacchari]MCW0414398.1 hypothetical protein [Xanthomonas sacchari]MCW0435050.1 hypothetical protein [Xanthomonas sacchari]MCW0455736.1 hypothetical protein [Xanthomonas sacchari]